MKLRNKKTGKIVIVEFISDYQTDDGTEIGFRVKNTLNYYSYPSIAELNDEWEDVEDINVTNIPLIKDEKIRRAVRTWAEANNVNLVRIVGVRTLQSEHQGIEIGFNTDLFVGWVTALKTIDELCGEEEECKS